jgi:hypothetical protein
MCALGFNRIDLPVYETYEALEESITLVIHMELDGFNIQ